MSELIYGRYMVFTYSDYYPSGGLEDCAASFDKVEEVLAFLEKPSGYENITVFDRIEGKEVTDFDTLRNAPKSTSN